MKGLTIGKLEQERRGFSLTTTQPYSTKGTAGACAFLRARPHSIPCVEVSGSCLPRAGYAGCRGRDAYV